MEKNGMDLHGQAWELIYHSHEYIKREDKEKAISSGFSF
jgi:hypothetical protein